MTEAVAAEYPELLRELRDKLPERIAAAHGLDIEQAQAIVCDVTEYLRTEWGGQAIYMPKGMRYTLTQRDYEIYEQFRGDNYDVLARQYHLTEMRIRQIVAAVRAADIERRQGSLI